METDKRKLLHYPQKSVKLCQNTFSGFTLLEVLISLSIVSIVFVALFRMQAGNIRLADSQLFNITAARLAQEKLVEITGELQDIQDRSGTFDQAFENFHWSCSVGGEYTTPDEKWISKDAAKRLKLIHIEIIRGGDSYKISAWRYLPDE